MLPHVRLIGGLIGTMVVLAACGSTTAGTQTSAGAFQLKSPPPNPAYEQRIISLKGQTLDASKFKKTGPYTLALLSQGPGNGWGKSYQVTAEWAAKNNPNVKSFTDDLFNFNLQTQITQMENAIARHPDAIVLHPAGDGVVGAAKSAIAAGIPVILCSNGLPDDTAFQSLVTVDYWTTGVQIAQQLAQDLNGQGNVVFMGGNSVYEHTQVYEKAAKDTLALYPGIKVIATTYSNYSVSKGKTDMEALLASNPKIDGIYSAGSEAAIGGIQALLERKLKMPAFAVSNDLNGFVRLAKENNIKYVAAPAPGPMSAACVDTAVKILQGTNVPRFIEAEDATPNSHIYDQTQLSSHYYPQFNDDFVGPPVAPDAVYLSAGFGR